MKLIHIFFIVFFISTQLSFSSSKSLTPIKELISFKPYKYVTYLQYIEDDLFGFISNSTIFINSISTGRTKNSIQIENLYNFCYLKNDIIAILTYKLGVSIYNIKTNVNMTSYELKDIANFVCLDNNRILIYNKNTISIIDSQTGVKKSSVFLKNSFNFKYQGDDIVVTSDNNNIYILDISTNTIEIKNKLYFGKNIYGFQFVGKNKIVVGSDMLYLVDFLTGNRETLIKDFEISEFENIGVGLLAFKYKSYSHNSNISLLNIMNNNIYGLLINDVHFSSMEYIPDNQLLVLDEKIRISIWNTKSIKETRSYNGHSFYVESISNIGNDLVVSSSNYEMIVWNSKTGQIIQNIKNILQEYTRPQILYIRNDQIASINYNKINIFSLISGEIVKHMMIQESNHIISMVYLNDRRLAVSTDKTVYIFNLDTSELLTTIPVSQSGSLISINYIQNDMLVVLLKENVYIYNVISGLKLKTLNLVSRNLSCYFKDGILILPSVERIKFYIYNIITEVTKIILTGSVKVDSILNFNNEEFITYTNDGDINFWNYNRLEVVSNMSISRQIFSIASLDNNQIALAVDEGFTIYKK